jgi:hypothetical protein
MTDDASGSNGRKAAARTSGGWWRVRKNQRATKATIRMTTTTYAQGSTAQGLV